MNVYYVAGIPYSDELYHFGIKGQKWGVRRYQNLDGSLTEAGKAHYGTSNGKIRYTEKLLYKNMEKASNNIKRLDMLNRTPLNRIDFVRRKNAELVKSYETSIKKERAAINRYKRLTDKEKKSLDRIMRFRNFGNASFKGFSRPVTQKYVDSKLYGKKSNKEYATKILAPVAGLAVGTLTIVNAPKIGSFVYRHL